MPDGTHPTAPEATLAGEAHYLKAVAEVGDARRIAVTRPIYAANGIKLLDAGAALTSRTLERLVGHRLAAPVEESIAAEGTVRPADVVARARELTATQPLLARLVPEKSDGTRLWARLADAPLPPSVLFRLTVAREKYGDLYDHSLRAAVVALAIGARARFGDRELELLATAALMHDFGMLHADTALLAGDRPLDPVVRRQLRAHPLTGMLIAQREPQLNPAIAIAILQHHERLDGGGYPSAPPPERITRMARVLMLVEIALAMVEHRSHLAELQLSLILRANHRSFDRELANVLLAALPRLQDDPAAPAALNEGAARQMAGLLAHWNRVKAAATAGVEQDARAFVDERLRRLRRFFIEAGLDLESDTSASALFGDDWSAQAELNGLVAEALWHVRQIACEVVLQWPHLAGDDQHAGDTAPSGLRTWLQQVAASCGNNGG